ncbi:hypothetical protein [Streptomyces iconiensis]|uniref:Uncharacterized protein n=1 Tax=Streptomyces iconiensis TaxID=1384038 RepID=A0ABT7A9B1_9ACTN|nr:hypothetical protein [Streptomyces iconiensis]MDJ1137944.1 hypothetical protein [Streptomyces iconiensis]
MPEASDHTYATRFRIPKIIWEAYGRVVPNRNADLLDHVRTVIAEHGTDQDRADLEAGERELTERRSRKGGRPRRSPTKE